MLGTVLLRDGVVDLMARRVWRVGAVSRLSGSEVEVLSMLGANLGRTVDRQELLVRALNFPADSLSRAVDLCVHRLRTKVERDPAHPVHLITIQGEGYRLVPATRVEEVRTNVVPARSPLVGRTALVDRVRAALDHGPVALLGPAGVGKSRLAHAIAADAGRTWAPAGSWWIDLAAVHGLEEAVRAVAGVVGVEAETPEGLAALGSRGPSLVVLDTCERCVDVAARIAAGLAGAARVLLTSRVAVPGVETIAVPPLDRDDAMALLVDRAGERTLDRAAVGRVVDAVDRLPLAIELAAARLSALPLVRVEQELVRPLRLLRDRTGTGRQASVEASIRWSWEALGEADRASLTQLSVFRGPVPDDALATLVPSGAVARLEAAHLVRRVADGVVPWHAVREFAASEAGSEAWSRVSAGHAGWAAQFAERRLAELWGPAYPQAIRALDLHDADLAAAEPHLTGHGIGAVAFARAELAFDGARYRRVLELTEAGLRRVARNDPRRLSLVSIEAGTWGRLGDWPQAEVRGRAALAEAGTPLARIEASYVLALALMRCDRHAESLEVAARGLTDAGDDPVLRARALGTWMFVHINRSDAATSLDCAKDALAAVEAADIERLRTHAIHNVAVALVRAGRIPEALPTLREAAVRFGRNRRASGIAHLNLAILQTGDPPAALENAERALEAFRDAGSADGERAALGMCGVYRALVGDVVDGLADLDEVCAQHVGSTASTATQARLLRAVALALVGRTSDARGVFAEIRGDVVREMGMSEDEADALIAAWVDQRPVPAEVEERLGRVGGDRTWLHVQLLRVAGRV